MKSFWGWGEWAAAAVESWNSLIFVLSSLFCLADAASSLVTSNLIPTRSSPLLLLLLCFSFLKRSAFRDFLEILTFVWCYIIRMYIHILISRTVVSGGGGRRGRAQQKMSREWGDRREDTRAGSEWEKKHFKKKSIKSSNNEHARFHARYVVQGSS